METEKTYFNSSLNREEYAVIKDEAYKLGITIKEHISSILYAYVKRQKEERSSVTNNT